MVGLSDPGTTAHTLTTVHTEWLLRVELSSAGWQSYEPISKKCGSKSWKDGWSRLSMRLIPIIYGYLWMITYSIHLGTISKSSAPLQSFQNFSGTDLRLMAWARGLAPNYLDLLRILIQFSHWIPRALCVLEKFFYLLDNTRNTFFWESSLPSFFRDFSDK